jgi:hypothetical protein
MKVILVGLGLLLAAASLAPAADAAPGAKKKYAKQRAATAYARRDDAAADRNRDGWIERDANKLPFGSAQWWDQMMREDRTTGGFH